MNYWDLALLLVVLCMAVPLAYMRRVSCKAFILSLPFPGTVAMLSLGKPVNASNILGLTLLMLFTHIVRFLYYKRITKNVPAIIIAAVCYGLMGSLLNRIYPMTTLGFFIALAWNIVVAVCLLKFMKPRREPGQKSHLPVPLKILSIILIVSTLIVLKKILSGFMVVFPMVSMIAMYESRYALWTICRQMAVIMITFGVFFTTIFLLQNVIGFYAALACGWAVFVSILIPLHRRNFPKK